MMKQQHKRPFQPETCGVPPSEEVVQISQVRKIEKVREDFSRLRKTFQFTTGRTSVKLSGKQRLDDGPL